MFRRTLGTSHQSAGSIAPFPSSLPIDAITNGDALDLMRSTPLAISPCCRCASRPRSRSAQTETSRASQHDSRGRLSDGGQPRFVVTETTFKSKRSSTYSVKTSKRTWTLSIAIWNPLVKCLSVCRAGLGRCRVVDERGCPKPHRWPASGHRK